MINESRPLVRLIDDDPEISAAQSLFLRLEGIECTSYTSATSFLEKDNHARPGCLVLDVQMPEMSGLDLQQIMAERKIDLPIIFLSAHGSISMALECVRLGAFSFLEKPPLPNALLELVRGAISKNLADRRLSAYIRSQLKLFDTLTPAEKAVAALVAKGLSTSVIAQIQNISESTVKSHRNAINQKLDVLNAIELADFLREIGEIGS